MRLLYTSNDIQNQANYYTTVWVIGSKINSLNVQGQQCVNTSVSNGLECHLKKEELNLRLCNRTWSSDWLRNVSVIAIALVLQTGLVIHVQVSATELHPQINNVILYTPERRGRRTQPNIMRSPQTPPPVKRRGGVGEELPWARQWKVDLLSSSSFNFIK